ncbi:glycoside hydrolase family 128 protein [Aulographum hederae CBS 113979]|uniref:Glycoside hydrolase family 128 protein n=1 Tax=Aulographum hederae CBS 113979 TaxID=1176131 RepID=A0A6G1GJN2_9PEZI|nr:glycoside hydrolase family 128 protein [Aulographum hederae CBS 113979]
MAKPNGELTGTFTSCIQKCAERSGCVLVDYIADQGTCYLKSSVGAKISGSKGVWGAQVKKSTAAATTQTKSTTSSSSSGGNKRGVAYNDGSLASLYKTSNSKVSWGYNWIQWEDDAFKSSGFPFFPMLHDTGADRTASWVSDAKKTGATHALSFNEPDQCGGGGTCMTDPVSTAGDHKEWFKDLEGGSMKIVAPAVTNGPAPMGLDYLKKFLSACEKLTCQIDVVAIHWYSPPVFKDFKSHVEAAYEAGGGRPVWITEFAPSGSTDEKVAFLKEVLPWLDAQDYVEKYAYHWTNEGSDLVQSSALTSIGSVYSTY